MTVYTRRARLASTLQRLQTADIGELKAVQAGIQNELEALRQSIVNAEHDIERLEARLVDWGNGLLQLDLSSVQTLQRYLDEQQLLRVRMVADQRRISQRLDQANRKLQRAVLEKKAYGKLEAASLGAQQVLENKTEAERTLELWLPQKRKSI